MFKELLDKLNFWQNSSKSRYQAKSRLQLVIAHDRAGINPEIIDKMRQEILEIVNRYLDVDLEQTEFFIETKERNTSLTANLPIKKVKRTTTNIN